MFEIAGGIVLGFVGIMCLVVIAYFVLLIYFNARR